MLRKMYDKTLELSAHPKAVWYLALVCFIESSFFPIPPYVMIMPMVLANRQKAWFYAAVATISSVLGGLLGYFIGYFFFQSIALPLLEIYSYQDEFAHIQAIYDEYGAWIVLLSGVSPLPYKVITIMSGLAQMNLVVFIACSIVIRALRFFVFAGLLWKFGEPMKGFIDKHFNMLTILFFVLCLGAFGMVKLA